MFPRRTDDNLSLSISYEHNRRIRAQVENLQQHERSESRVSTDSDIDFELEDDYDGYVAGGDDYRNSCLPDLLVQRHEQVQQQDQKREDRDPRSTSYPCFELAEESFRDKMRRISQWRESTRQSETSSDYSLPELDPEPVRTSPSRKRRLSDASYPTSSKRSRSVASPKTPDSPFLSYSLAYSLDPPSDGASNIGTNPHACIMLPTWEGLHLCSACDATFISRQHLRLHGRSAPDACKAAVTYVLE